MHSSALRGRRRTLAAVALAALAGVAVALPSLAERFAGPRYEKRGVLHVVRQGNAHYSFDPVWRAESLRIVDPATGLDAAPGRGDGACVDGMRNALLRELGVQSLEQIPAEGAAEIEAIRALGYI